MGLSIEDHENEGQVLFPRHLLVAKADWDVVKGKLEDVPRLLVCSQRPCLGIKGQQPTGSWSRTALGLGRVWQTRISAQVLWKLLPPPTGMNNSQASTANHSEPRTALGGER